MTIQSRKMRRWGNLAKQEEEAEEEEDFFLKEEKWREEGQGKEAHIQA